MRRGLAIIEAAVVLPLVLLFVLGVLEYGWLFWKAADINNACRQGSRVGSRGGATATDVTDAVLAALTNAGLEASGYTVTIAPLDPETLDSGEALTVTVSVPYANIALVNLALIPTPVNLRATVVMAREGP
jgi:Flp pilus assembly protein TadG